MKTASAAWLAIVLVACGGRPLPADETASAEHRASETTPRPSTDTDNAPTGDAEPAPVAEAAAPDPVDVEAGVRLGPVRLGMTAAEVRALGLTEEGGRFGFYRVTFRDDRATRIEASMGDLGRIRIADRVIEVGTHIHAIRDAIGGCQWVEGGGERYRCANGTLLVQTTHSMSPERYAIAVEAR